MNINESYINCFYNAITLLALLFNIIWQIKDCKIFEEILKNNVYFIAVVNKAAVISNGALAGSPVLAVELNQPIPLSGSMNFDQCVVHQEIT